MSGHASGGVGDSNKLRSAKPTRTSFFQSTKIPARVPRVKNAALSGSGNVWWDGGGGGVDNWQQVAAGVYHHEVEFRESENCKCQALKDCL